MEERIEAMKPVRMMLIVVWAVDDADLVAVVIIRRLMTPNQELT